MMLDRYFAGTVSVAANGIAVTGTGTAWVANGVQAGDYLHARGLMIRIAAVVGNTSLTLAEGWPGGALSGSSYAILYRIDADRYGAAMLQLLTSLESGNLSSLADLAGTSGRVPYFAGTNALAETPLTAWGRSLIDDNDAAGFWATVGATSGAAQAYRRGNVLSSVSQSGGVPTGGLIESGADTGGRFVRLANGTQICRSGMIEVSVPAGSYVDVVWTYPRSFTSMPDIGHSWWSAGTAANIAAALAAGCNCAVAPGASSAIVVFRNSTGSTLTMRASNVAVGEWY